MSKLMRAKNERYEEIKQKLKQHPRKWLITGVAGFIGSNLLEELLKLNQEVVGIDNFITGHLVNIEDVKKQVTPEEWRRFQFIEGDIRNLDMCKQACKDIDHILHQAALGSVPRSIEFPELCYSCNVNGHLNMMIAAKDTQVKSFVYASSSSVYGDHPGLPKIENEIGRPLSPYAASKLSNEINAGVFHSVYGLKTVGLRYFNVFGKRQDPAGPYAAVIPRWIRSMVKNEKVIIYGDGLTARDFCYIQNVMQMNILASLAENDKIFGQIFNVACGEKTSLNDLFEHLSTGLSKDYQHLHQLRPHYEKFRPGDIKFSLANFKKAEELLHYRPTHYIADGIFESLEWYKKSMDTFIKN